jgi:hypothetical protein
MSLLRETVNDYIVDKLEEALSFFENKFEKISFKLYGMLEEGVLDNLPPEVDAAMQELEKRLAAARKGLGLTNKLPPGESRVLHRRRILTNLNHIRAKFRQLDKILQSLSSGGFNKDDGDYIPDSNRFA